MLSAFASREAQSTFTGKITYTIYYSYISHTGKIPRLPLNLKTFRLHREQVARVSMGCIALLPVNLAKSDNKVVLLPFQWAALPYSL